MSESEEDLLQCHVPHADGLVAARAVAQHESDRESEADLLQPDAVQLAMVALEPEEPLPPAVGHDVPLAMVPVEPEEEPRQHSWCSGHNIPGPLSRTPF